MFFAYDRHCTLPMNHEGTTLKGLELENMYLISIGY